MQDLSVTDATLRHPALARSTNPLNLFAAVAWSHLTEPGDEFAGFLRQTLGEAMALTTLVQGVENEVMLGALDAVGCRELAEDRFVDVGATVDDSLARWRPRLSMATVLNSLDIASRLGVELVDQNHEHWPAQLSSLEFAAPSVLWVRGHTSVLGASKRSWAVVGCRTPTSYGFDVTTSLVQGLAEENFTVVSGGAFGIDAIAHKTALVVETPTLAVMAGGVDRLYPRTNEPLLQQIIIEGAVISEVAIGTAPTKWRFLQRNRIIAALSAGTVIVEAGYRSGAINTANHAMSLGRIVAAVPGSILSAKSQGTNKLIADSKALLVGSAKDLIDLYLEGITSPSFVPSDLTPLEVRALDSIGFASATFENICTDAGITRAEAEATLKLLIQKGHVFQREGFFVRA